jgi:hypothetical protein
MDWRWSWRPIWVDLGGDCGGEGRWGGKEGERLVVGGGGWEGVWVVGW